MNELEKARLEIDKIDKEMAKLFEERMKAVEHVVHFKMENNLPVFDASREAKVISKNLENISNDTYKTYYEDYLHALMDISKKYQKTFMEPKKVAYQGQEITTQAVYFISLAEITNVYYRTTTNILYKDPEWGPMDIKLAGSYGIKVSNPVNLLTNVNSNADEYYFTNLNENLFYV